MSSPDVDPLAFFELWSDSETKGADSGSRPIHRSRGIGYRLGNRNTFSFRFSGWLSTGRLLWPSAFRYTFP